MMALAPWQPSTAYVQFEAVVNGGQIYVCVTAGTSASSGGPTNVTTGNSGSDGTAAWTWWGANTVTHDPSLSLSNWAASTAYSLGNRVINSGKVYGCVAAGTSAGSGGPTTTSNAITDNTVTWTYMGPYQLSPYANDFPTFTYSSSLPGSLPNIYTITSADNFTVRKVFIEAAGSGYAVGDTLTFANAGSGTSTVSIVLTVTSVSSGAITGVTITNAGNYTTQATNQCAPTSTSGAGSGATFTFVWTAASWCKARGGYPVGNAALHSRMLVFQGAANAALSGAGSAIEFVTDAPKLYFRSINGNTRGLNVIIDGVRYAMSGSLFNSANANNYFTFDFSATSGRKRRLWRVESSGGTWYPSSVAVDGLSTVWAPDDTDQVIAAFVGDSIVSGSAYGPFLAGNRCNLRVGAELGWTVWEFAQGGTGFVNRGASPGTTTESYSFRIAQAVAINPDVVILQGSTNDIGQSGVAAAVTAAIRQVRAALPNAIIIVLGVWPLNNASVGATETLVQAGVAAAADPKTYFVPVYYDLDGPWVSGTWNNNPFPTGFANTNRANSTLMIAGDNTHPSDQGIAYYASRIANAIKRVVLPYIT